VVCDLDPTQERLQASGSGPILGTDKGQGRLKCFAGLGMTPRAQENLAKFRAQLYSRVGVGVTAGTVRTQAVLT
jgi:hypothetical protein